MSLAVSVYDQRDEIQFELNSTNENKHPTLLSSENIFGRKCFQLKFITGGRTFVAGFMKSDYAAFINTFSLETKVTIRTPIIGTKTFSIAPLIANTSYLICIDTRERRFLFVNDSQIWSFNYSKNAPKMPLFVQERPSGRNSFIIKMRGPFDISLPSAFFTMSDHRHFEFVSCRNKRKQHSLFACTIATYVLSVSNR